MHSEMETGRKAGGLKHSSASNYIIGNGIYDVELVY